MESALGFKIWLLVQNSDDKWGEITESVYCGFRDKKADIAQGEPTGLLLQSPGGLAAYAYKIVRLFQRRTDKLSTIVPIYAKSAATLMAVGGHKLIMGMDAELGPLDVQIYDEDKDHYDSALNAVQSLERLNAYALTAFDQAMQLLIARMGKKPEILMGTALNYANGMVKPLVEKIDTFELTRRSRELKVAEDYAVRLMMMANYSERDAKRIASNLVEQYSTHDFVIDHHEVGAHTQATKMPLHHNLKVSFVPQIEDIFTKLTPYLERSTIIGRVEEMQP